MWPFNKEREPVYFYNISFTFITYIPFHEVFITHQNWQLLWSEVLPEVHDSRHNTNNDFILS